MVHIPADRSFGTWSVFARPYLAYKPRLEDLQKVKLKIMRRLEDIIAHRLRHSFAKKLVDAGTPLHRLPDWQSIIAPDFLRPKLAPLDDDKHCAQPCGAALAN